MELQSAAALTHVCTHLDEIRAELHDPGTDPATPLQRLLAALSPGAATAPADLAELLAAVHTALMAAGDPYGIYGDTARIGGGDLIGVETVEIVYRCPLARCTGRMWSEVTEAAPVCSVSGAELLRERLT